MIQPTILMGIGTTEILIIVLVLLLLFGGKKIPELMRGLGRGIKEFKDGKDGADADQPNNTNSNTNSNTNNDAR